MQELARHIFWNPKKSCKKTRLEEFRKNWSIGTLEQIRERLKEYQEAGIQELIVRFVDATRLEPVRLFARDYLQQR